MGQLLYYALFLGFARNWLLEYPWLVGMVVVIYLLRHRLPDPYLWAKTAARRRQLWLQVLQNPDNAVARRDLALISLERNRPQQAIVLLEEARRRDPQSAELAYLLALAMVRGGRPADALPLLQLAEQTDPKLRYGEVYLTAGIALTALDRGAEAEDSLLRYLKINASSVEGWVRLARLRRAQGDKDGARAALQGAMEAFEQNPRFRRRKELGWYLRAMIARVI